jgi:hypothetical protein
MTMSSKMMSGDSASKSDKAFLPFVAANLIFSSIWEAMRDIAESSAGIRAVPQCP